MVIPFFFLGTLSPFDFSEQGLLPFPFSAAFFFLFKDSNSSKSIGSPNSLLSYSNPAASLLVLSAAALALVFLQPAVSETTTT
ncbi:hypothetical protein LIER_31731 [Lithospermum erythrorhizon]|uniref:Uncharacterized protein n=1 Tax=Lithospermum erythrorhizon TaxID=34254 RepID=A0AAV3RRV1_LITER